MPLCGNWLSVDWEVECGARARLALYVQEHQMPASCARLRDVGDCKLSGVAHSGMLIQTDRMQVLWASIAVQSAGCKLVDTSQISGTCNCNLIF